MTTTESPASQMIREAGRASREAASWANPLSRAERRALAERLGRASKRLHNVRAADGLYSPSGVRASVECQDLYTDVTERAEVPSS